MKLLDYRQFVDRIGSIYFSQIKYFYKKVKEKGRKVEKVSNHKLSPSKFRHFAV